MATISVTIGEGKYDIGTKYDSAMIDKILDKIRLTVSKVGTKSYNVSMDDPLIEKFIPDAEMKNCINKAALIRMCFGLFIRSGCVRNMNHTNSAVVAFDFSLVGAFRDESGAIVDNLPMTLKLTYAMVSDAIAKSGIQSACIRGFMKALSTSDIFIKEFTKIDAKLKQCNNMTEAKTILATSEFLGEPASFKRIRPRITNPHRYIIECIDFLDTSFFNLDDQVVRALSQYTNSRSR